MRVPGSPWKTFQITLLSTLHNVRITSVTLWYNGISLQSDQWDWVSAWLLFSMACISTNSSSLPTILHPEYVPRLMHHFTKFSSGSSSPDSVPIAWWASDGVTLRGAACSFWHPVHAVFWAYAVMEAVHFCLLFLYLELHC